MKKLNILILLSSLCCHHSLLQAEIWGFVDDSGEVFIANTKLDKRYQLFTKSGAFNEILPQSSPINLPKVNTPKVNKNLVDNYQQLVHEVARQHKLDPALVHAVITVESGYAHTAVSHKGAIGLMQVMPATGERFGITELTHPRSNITAGAKYLKFLLKLFKEDLPLVLAAYNAGEGAVIKYKYTIPPYAETQNYVAKVLAVYQKDQNLKTKTAPILNKKRITAVIAPDI